MEKSNDGYDPTSKKFTPYHRISQLIDFKSRLVATIVPDEVYIWRYRPRVRFQSGLAIDKLFDKFKVQQNTP